MIPTVSSIQENVLELKVSVHPDSLHLVEAVVNALHAGREAFDPLWLKLTAAKSTLDALAISLVESPEAAADQLKKNAEKVQAGIGPAIEEARQILLPGNAVNE